MLPALEAHLREHGYKLTRPRRAVLRVVAEAARPLSPAQVFARARRHYPALGLVTVYRTLEILDHAGVVRRLHGDDGCHTYVVASPGHAHHIICASCSRAAEFVNCDLEALLRAVGRETGYTVEQHWLELFGLCPECQARQRQRKKR